VAVSDYDSSGPHWEGETILNPGDRTSVKGTIPAKPRETYKKVRITITVPASAKGEFLVTPYDTAGRHEKEAVILMPGDTYSEVKEVK
jgi:hypothetical protein